MKKRNLFINTRVYTQSDGQVFDSMAVNKNRIVAVGNNLQYEQEFKGYAKVDLEGKSIVPGLVDAHTHFFYYAMSLSQVSLVDTVSIDDCLQRVETHAIKLGKNEWVLGEGFAPDRFRKREWPNREQLDRVTGGRPAFLFSKDEHSAWVNSKALELGGITKKSKDPGGGRIERAADGQPSGILREKPAYMPIFKLIPPTDEKKQSEAYAQALKIAYSRGVTGVHSFDDSLASFEHYVKLAERERVGLRVNYYFPASRLAELKKEQIYYGTGTDFFRIAGIKIFGDGALGSQTAYCFNKYIGSKDNYGIEVSSVAEMTRQVKAGLRLGLPSAIHAIGDRAVDNVLQAFEQTSRPDFGARHRIEHLQLIRRKDIKRLKALGVTASMQPSQCPSDIPLLRAYWGKRSSNAFCFRTLKESGVPLAFGSDVPIEPLDPLAGIIAAVRRARPHSRDIFYPEQRLTALEGLHGFTAGAAYAVGQEDCRGHLLPDYPADFVILSGDIGAASMKKLSELRVLATVLDGQIVFADKESGL
ncbi:MAG: amidohydrolase family protein [bacterium]|nr:amidohydrolase family protein [bacterium]